MRVSSGALSLPLTLAELAEVHRAAMVVGCAAEDDFADHLAVGDLALETVGYGAAFVACLELHAHLLSCELADHVAFELLRLLVAGELAALLLQAQFVRPLAVEETHA